MDTTFISIHDLTENATILYSSDSIIDVLGYTPDEIVNRPVWDLFLPEELPYAQEFHRRRVRTDKAAVLAYCQVRHKSGDFVGCECCFTIVYDVMVVCTSIYKQGLNAEKRALEAPRVRRIFSSSPNDPRYHMLSHLSAKFTQSLDPQLHEPRAALFLNRFTRTLTIMYATSGVQEVIGMRAEELRGRSFYYCIAENCLKDAVKCLENAKGNDSIAYLRFWYRDPRQDDIHRAEIGSNSDVEMTTDSGEGMSDSDTTVNAGPGYVSSPDASDRSAAAVGMDVDSDEHHAASRDSSGHSTRQSATHDSIFGVTRPHESSASSLDPSPERGRRQPAPQEERIELEAVISCTSDGLVVCLRRARTAIPHPSQRPSRAVFETGLFAAPWATDPIIPPVSSRANAGYNTSFAPSLGPHGARISLNINVGVSTSRDSPFGGPESHSFMNAIREQAIFAWALTGINGTLAEHSTGKPRGEALPANGLPVWASAPHVPHFPPPVASQPQHQPPQNQQSSLSPTTYGGEGDHHAGGTESYGIASTTNQPSHRSPSHIFGDPGLSPRGKHGTSGNNSNNSQYGR